METLANNFWFGYADACGLVEHRLVRQEQNLEDLDWEKFPHRIFLIALILASSAVLGTQKRKTG